MSSGVELAGCAVARRRRRRVAAAPPALRAASAAGDERGQHQHRRGRRASAEPIRAEPRTLEPTRARPARAADGGCAARLRGRTGRRARGLGRGNHRERAGNLAIGAAHAGAARQMSARCPVAAAAFAVVVERQIVFAVMLVTIPASAAAPARRAASSRRETHCASPRSCPRPSVALISSIDRPS